MTQSSRSDRRSVPVDAFNIELLDRSKMLRPRMQSYDKSHRLGTMLSYDKSHRLGRKKGERNASPLGSDVPTTFNNVLLEDRQTIQAQPSSQWIELTLEKGLCAASPQHQDTVMQTNVRALIAVASNGRQSTHSVQSVIYCLFFSRKCRNFKSSLVAQ
jgi:hypothetical protein